MRSALCAVAAVAAVLNCDFECDSESAEHHQARGETGAGTIEGCAERQADAYA